MIEFPAVEIDAVEKRNVARIDVGDFFWLRVGARQFFDLEIAETALRAFRFQREIPLPRTALADARNEAPVDREFDDAVVGLHAVMIPLPFALAVVLRREAARPAVW